MYSENEIDHMMDGIHLASQSLDLWILDTTAKRIKQIKEEPNERTLEFLLQVAEELRRIKKRKQELEHEQELEILALILLLAQDAYKDAKPFFDYKGITQVPLKENKECQRIIREVQKNAISDFRRMTKSPVYKIRDRKNPKKFKLVSIDNMYHEVVNEAQQKFSSVDVDKDTAMDQTLEQLIDSKLRVKGDDGRTTTLENAVDKLAERTAKEISQQMRDEVGKQFGADGVEITVHAYPAPDHAPVQGHQFTNEEYEKLQTVQPAKDVNGTEFPAMQRAIGMWNCRHYTYPIIVGHTKPNFSQEQLDKILKYNNKGYTDSYGRHYTMYECTQYQRQLEREIRHDKMGQMTAQSADDTELAKKYRASVSVKTKKYKAFSEACGLKYRTDRIRVPGYKK